ncbi:MAG: class I SAM-dependent rRNA methyltransferase [Hyperthermus sp.]|nr:MAG: class I SAM-dependent rRNA methyltransferase [Hyperthermus sp.]
MAGLAPSVVVSGEGARLVRERGVLNIYSKWVKPLSPGIRAGEVVVVEDEEGDLLGCGFYDTVGPVRVRLVELWECRHREPWDIIVSGIESALKARRVAGIIDGWEAYRLVHSDGDSMPGLIVDVYGDLAVYQSSSIVWDTYSSFIAEALKEVVDVRNIYEKSDQRTRREIGLAPRERLVAGATATTIIEEDGVKMLVDPRSGQKTGLFLDQRVNRVDFGKMAEGIVLDLFSYSGGFGLHALVNGGAERVVFVEEDEEAVRMLRENLRMNRVEEKARIVKGDAWTFIHRAIARRERYNGVVVDPPAFIPRPDVYERGRRAYARLYHYAARLAAREGLLFLSSCSSHLAREDYVNIVSEALASARTAYNVIGGVRGAPPDHPIRPGAAYLDYLKSMFLVTF